MNATSHHVHPTPVPAIGVAYVDDASGREALRAAYGLAANVDAQLRVISVVERLWATSCRSRSTPSWEIRPRP